MKKLCFICYLLCFSLYAIPSFSQSKKYTSKPNKYTNKSIFVDFNVLANNLSLKYDELIVLKDKSVLSYSFGISNLYKRADFIVPPNIGTPIEINYLYGEKWNYIEVGITFTPHFIFSKGYTHFNKENLEIKIAENTNLIYITPHIGIRSNIKEIIKYKVSVGPRIKVVESNNEYIGRIFENKRYLELFFFQLSLGVPL